MDREGVKRYPGADTRGRGQVRGTSGRPTPTPDGSVDDMTGGANDVAANDIVVTLPLTTGHPTIGVDSRRMSSRRRH